MNNYPERPTIIDFVEKYSRKFADNVYIREKVGDNGMK